jgi:hypothetical protein
MAYILSAAHSGSTLLAMLLGVQGGAFTVGEIRAPSMGDPDLYRCSCGQKIKECAFWLSVSAQMKRKGVADFDITRAGTSIFELKEPYAGRLLAPLPRGSFLEACRDLALGFSAVWKPHLGEVLRRNFALVQVLQELADASIIIDSSKSPLHLKYLLSIPRLEIKIIHLVRDGRAMALSSLVSHGPKRATRLETLAAGAHEWCRSNASAECVLRTLPSSQWVRVHYEELCRQPEATLRSLGRFLGLECDKVALDFRSRQLHVLGNDMRLKSTSEIRLDERWRTQLSPEDLASIDRVAGSMIRKYGYS